MNQANYHKDVSDHMAASDFVGWLTILHSMVKVATESLTSAFAAATDVVGAKFLRVNGHLVRHIKGRTYFAEPSVGNIEQVKITFIDPDFD